MNSSRKVCNHPLDRLFHPRAVAIVGVSKNSESKGNMYLRQLHRLCDWVVTVDRNAGIEYFASPRDNREIYDAYVTDCVPEREDMGGLQLTTSTRNFE